MIIVEDEKHFELLNNNQNTDLPDPLVFEWAIFVHKTVRFSQLTQISMSEFQVQVQVQINIR